MREERRQWASVLAAVAATALLVGGGPPLAAAVFDANNADKVDGRHAVGPTATAAQRARTLVATNSAGRLPNDIIAKALDTDRLDALDSTALQRRVTGTCTATQKIRAVTAAGAVTCGTDATNGDAATLDGYDSTDFEAKKLRTIFVPRSTTPASSGNSLVNWLQNLPGGAEPSATNRWLIQLDAGTYQLDSTLLMRPYVDIRGSGHETLITCTCLTAVQLAANSRLERLAIYLNGQLEDGIFVGVSVVGPGTQMIDIDVTIVLTQNGIGIYSEDPTSITDSEISVFGSNSATAIILGGGTSTLTDTTVVASGGATEFGIQAVGGDVNVRGGEVIAQGAAESVALLAVASTARVTSSFISASGVESSLAVRTHTGGNALIQSSRLHGDNDGTMTCVASSNDLFAPLNASCDP